MADDVPILEAGGPGADGINKRVRVVDEEARKLLVGNTAMIAVLVGILHQKGVLSSEDALVVLLAGKGDVAEAGMAERLEEKLRERKP